MFSTKRWLDKTWEGISIFFGSLFYNNFLDWNYCIDTAFTPLFWLLDNYGGKLGFAFVIICIILMSSVISICYWIGLPYYWEKNPALTIFLVIFGNWLKMNCIFHYYMGIKCKPGNPPQDTLFEDVASICKKCIQPKPHRTHHCSICNVCILQMDHHCPWLNNCVGHFNRRYFYMFMVYIEISVLFLIIFGIEIAYKELWLHLMPPEQTSGLYGYAVEINSSNTENWVITPSNQEGHEIAAYEEYKSIRRKCILFTGIICVGVAIAIGFLLVRHSRMISRGETSIEKHINNSERKKLAAQHKIYKNPYDFGLYYNWTIFLGIGNGSSRSWFHVIFPSSHKPFGDGITWPNINSSTIEFESFFNHKQR